MSTSSTRYLLPAASNPYLPPNYPHLPQYTFLPSHTAYTCNSCSLQLLKDPQPGFSHSFIFFIVTRLENSYVVIRFVSPPCASLGYYIIHQCLPLCHIQFVTVTVLYIIFLILPHTVFVLIEQASSNIFSCPCTSSSNWFLGQLLLL